ILGFNGQFGNPSYEISCPAAFAGAARLKRSSLCVISFYSKDFYEASHPSRIQEFHDHLRLRLCGRDALHRGQHSRGDLLELPPVFYRQAEAHRRGRPGRKVPQEIRLEELSAKRRAEIDQLDFPRATVRAKGGDDPFALFISLS